ncbi:MAG TPA: glycosyltransferase [Halanaerobiales bacterium]|nr:glycosyltransferase [Halanaerobiales bacterium]
MTEKKKVLLIGNIGLYKKVEPNGVNVKNRHIIKYLKGVEGISLKIIDSYNWKKRFIQLVFNILVAVFQSERIIVSVNSRSAYRLFGFLSLFNLSDRAIYMVVGGSLPAQIREQGFKIKYYKRIKKIFVQTSGMKKELNNMGLSNVEQLVNSKYFKRGSDRKNCFVNDPVRTFYLGRIHPEKGLDMLFEALKIVNKEKISYNLDFYGPVEKDYEDSFKRSVEKYNFANYCGIIDLTRDDAYNRLSSYDLFIFPTCWPGEGFPGVFIDAFISGVAILASDWNHNPEFIDNEENGLLFKTKDKGDLIAKLKYLYSNKKLIKRMKINSYNSADKYHSSEVLKVLRDEIFD